MPESTDKTEEATEATPKKKAASKAPKSEPKSEPKSKPKSEPEVVQSTPVESDLTYAAFSVERFIEDAVPLTGQPSYIVAGALATASGELTVKAVQDRIHKFLNAEVQEG
jgi:outer membrane biosynthesis protein TonB